MLCDFAVSFGKQKKHVLPERAFSIRDRSAIRFLLRFVHFGGKGRVDLGLLLGAGRHR